jgi:hypothetical protein
LVWLLVQTTPVQNFLVRQVTQKLSKDLGTSVRIDHVDFDLFDKMLLEGTLIRDKKNDTLLYAGSLNVRITDWFFIKDQIQLQYIGLENAMLHSHRTDSVWNYQFLLDYFTGPKSSGQQKSIELDLKEVEFNNFAIIQVDEWIGENVSASISQLTVDAKKFDLNRKEIEIEDLSLDKPAFAIYNYKGRRPKRTAQITEQEEEIVNDPLHLRWNADGWKILVQYLSINSGSFKTDRETNREPSRNFDGQHIFFSDIQADFRNLRLDRDTITAKVALSTKERSGFIVRSLQSQMKFHPEAMEFDSLDLRTNKSRLTNFFAMRYASFDDMGDFMSKVRMEGNFNDAEISSDDIAFFAPDVASWKKKIRVSGQVKGSVDNLNSKNLIVNAGNDTYFEGNVSMQGLPDINKTYIDFEAEEFRTTYKDAVGFIPALKQVTQPRLDRLGYVKFKGNFTGFIKDFVTYGSIETALGTVVSDLNMKLPDRGVAGYSGSIRSKSFNIGTLLENAQLGSISFEGTVNGSGLRPATLNAKLDGKIDLVEFNGYAYRNIQVAGNVAKRLFNGKLIAADENLKAQLDGLIDFSKSIPEFDFNASVTKADLYKLKLLKENIEFDGKFSFRFQGSNIDNFLGTARIYEASLFRAGKRISFDSLSIESKIINNNKVITALSNEFDAAIVGEFSIQDLPAAFQTFLNKYYPSYIKPSRKLLTNENFSFVISTKKVDDYIDLIHPNLSGFNYSTFTGRINSKENLLDLNAEVPQFNFKNIAVFDLKLKATGSYDSLSMETNIANVYINDSLHFPGTSIRLRSSNDLSVVNIQTSANQTLNSAAVNAMVTTVPDGARIRFQESHFDLNGKNWTIEENGELVLTNKFIGADGIKLFNGEQQILVTTVPSDIGNTNDIQIDLKSVNIGDFAPYVVRNNRLEGLLTGTVNIVDPFGKMMIELDAETEHFRLDNDSVGNVKLNGNYNQRTKQINFSGIAKNPDYNFDVKGSYLLADSSRKETLDISTTLDDTKIGLLQRYLSGVFSDLNGNATGTLRVIGPPDDLNYLGTIQLRDAGLRVKFTNVFYKIPRATIQLKENEIDFGSFVIQDELKNVGQITRGRLFHRGFDDLAFDFAMNTSKLLVLGTSNQGSDPYYGNVVARANMTFTGPLEAMQMDIEAEPADSSNLYINMRTGRESGQADFIVWKVYGREMKPVRETDESNLVVNLDVSANNLANVYVILDELTGDIIRANGRGNLKIRAGTDGEFGITGRYDIDRGNYNFSFESLLKKPFRLRENSGNYIQWTGDPNNARIDIDAEYEAENVRFSDLGLQAIEAASGTINDNVRRYRGKVLVLANLTGELLSPVIKFEIDLPQGSPLANDPDAAKILKQIQNDENELNKQVAFLVVFNSFGPLSTSTSQGNFASTAFEGIVVGSISGVLSNTLSRQFSNVFQKLFNDKSIRVNFNAQLYSGTNFVDNGNRNLINSIDRTNLNLSIGKSLFNERLTFTFGSAVDFGLSSAQVNATKNLPFLPDITAEWKISPDGKLVLTFFYRDSYNYLTGAGVRQNRSGASISYRREFDRFSELLNGNERKRKKKSEKIPVSGNVGRAEE